MTFGKIFKNSWNDYKRNFKSIFNFMFIFRGIPLIVFTLISIFFILNDPLTYNFLALGGNLKENLVLPWSYLIVSWIFGLFMLFLYLFVSGSFISLSLKKSKFSFRELNNEGKRVFFRYFCYSIVLWFFLILLFILLIIPGIIFFVYWAFSSYILLDKKNPILKSLKESRYLVKGRWWKVFGYILLSGLIYLAIAVIFGLITIPFYVIQFISSFSGTILSPEFFVISSIFGAISGFLTELVALPFIILFFKNFYLELKKKR